MSISEVIELLQLLISFAGVIVTLFIYINTKKITAPVRKTMAVISK